MRVTTIRSLSLASAALLLTGAAGAQMAVPGAHEVSPANNQAVSPPLRDLPLPLDRPGIEQKREKPIGTVPLAPGRELPDGALQTTVTTQVAATAGAGFAGVGNGDYGFVPDSAPPDTNGAVGATQYVQWVNESYIVFDKSGAKLLGPVKGNVIFGALGGGCAQNNDGDPIVQYDKIANRWILTQFVVSTTPYLQCVAVSQTSDATGAYNLYAFSYGTTQFPDYPKLGVWPDAYYISFNIFNNGQTWAGAKLCAYDRVAMLNGSPATQQCFQLSTNYGGLLPVDLDGTLLPPSGAPAPFINFGTNSLNLWRFHVDFAAPANTRLSGPIAIPVAPFTAACGGGTCIAQYGTSNQLDSLADRLMYRFAYRPSTTTHPGIERAVVNHSVKVSGNNRNQVVGVRWYELVNLTSGSPSVYQQGTFSPDSTSRWMGSIAMDKVGNIALGYSVSSGSINPGIRFTGRAPTDPAGTLQAESGVVNGKGSQTGNLHRWGDYSAMTVDPVDDCTFWYTNEYLKTSGSFNWSTWISSFKLPGCS